MNYIKALLLLILSRLYDGWGSYVFLALALGFSIVSVFKDD